MTDDAFLVKLSAILEVSADELNEQFKLDFGNWDSLTVMATIALIDEHFDLTVSPRELAACSSVKELQEFIGANTTKV